MLSKLTLESRYMFVTTEEQVKELLKMAETPAILSKMLIFIDSNLIVAGRHAYKLTVAMVHLMSQHRGFDFAAVVVKNPETKLDRRIELQVTHSSRIASKEKPKWS